MGKIVNPQKQGKIMAYILKIRLLGQEACRVLEVLLELDNFVGEFTNPIYFQKNKKKKSIYHHFLI